MRQISLAVLAASLIGVTPIQAADLFAAKGGWVGMGSLATSVDRPMQPARCEVNIDQKEPGSDVSMTGRCIVGAGGSDISFRIVKAGPDRVRAGMWSAATGETLQFDGSQNGEGLDLVATTPWVVDDESYATWIRVQEPDKASFAIRQLVRNEADGEDAPWRVIVDMVYRAK